jgi:protein-disulfide isomerase
MFDELMQATEIESDEWCLGDANAPVTILEYGDFECPHCAAARPVLAAVVHADPDTVRLVYRHFPVSSVHPQATLAAEAAEAAGVQGKFWEMHDMIFKHQDALEPENLRSYAEIIGLNLNQFDLAMRTHAYLPEVRADFQRGIQDGVNGTPTIFVNGVRYDGPRTIPAVQTAILLQLHAQRQPTT